MLFDIIFFMSGQILSAFIHENKNGEPNNLFIVESHWVALSRFFQILTAYFYQFLTAAKLDFSVSILCRL